MFDPKFFDDMAKKFSDGLPNQLQTLRADFEQTFKTALQYSFSKLDLVTREEFDIQTAVLAKTREKLTLLEARVEALDSK